MSLDAVFHREITLPADKLSPSLLSSIFDHLSLQLESLSRTKSGAFVAGLGDLEDVYYRVSQMMNQYQVRDLRCEFTISVDEGGVYRFTSLEKLQAANLQALSKQVYAVGVSWDLLILPPSSGQDEDDVCLPQRFKVNVAIEDPLRIHERTEDYLFLGIKLRQRNIPTASIRIAYSDYPVGRALLSTIEEWLEGLKTDSGDTIDEATRKWFSKVSSAFSALMPIAVIAGAIIFEPDIYSSVFTPIRYLLTVILLAIGAIFLAISADEKIAKLLYTVSPRTRFDLSAGDRKLAGKLERSRKKAYRNLWLIFVGLIMTALVGLFVNYLSAAIMGDR
jgi:hypothetical protein